jgi:hypothetical protein
MIVHISSGNSKLGKHIPNISLPPGHTCVKGVPCAASACYAHKAWVQYPNVRKAWTENLIHFMMEPDNYFADIQRYLWKHKPKRFRWHVAGDIPNQAYLNYMGVLARLNRLTNFLCFTKRYELSYSKLPKNLSIVISAWPGYAIINVPWTAECYTDPGGFLPIAWCQDGSETRIPQNAIACPGSCDACNLCWVLRGMGKHVWFHKH